MKTFLQELAEVVYKNNQKLDEVTMVFPNRRAALYFRKHLSNLINKPVFSPSILTIEEFISGFSKFQVPDKLELISILYKAYHSVLPGDAKEVPEAFDKFYFWGEMLLRDFEEADKYLVNVEHLFKDLSNQKELDTSFDFLTDEQKAFLRTFWGSFDENISANKRKFLQVWRQLPLIYQHFNEKLRERGFAYEGMLHREVANNLKNVSPTNRHLIFAGFNALTKAEETIISHFVKNENAEVYWDIDEYYVNNENQEAGRFFREYQQQAILKSTFPGSFPAFLSQKKNPGNKIKLFGAPQPMGQAKLMSQILQEHLRTNKAEDTLVVLPDEKLLLPVLHGVAGVTEHLNVTMGYPLSHTPLFNLVEIIIDLQLSLKDGHFNHRQVLAVIGHPYVIAADPISSNNKRKEILKRNWVHIPAGYLATEVETHRVIFQDFIYNLTESRVNESLIRYLKEIINHLGSIETLPDLDKEFCFHFIKFLNRLEEVFKEFNFQETQTASEKEKIRKIKSSLKSFLRLFRQLINTNKIPFTGEPLKGLQIMGVLETRNLDFKNVFVLSLNEGAFPASSNKGSYVPFNIRQAYGLPTVEHQDSMYAYLFYRVLQRAENIFLFYNSETDILGQGEMSRYLQQLVYESGIAIDKRILHNPIQPMDIHPIVVSKNKAVMQELIKLNDGNAYFQGISPSALNAYIECKLKFYFRHVAKIKEPNEVEEELDARVLGNFLHDVMENFYRGLLETNKTRMIDENDFADAHKKIDQLIDQVFIKNYALNPDAKVVYEGQRLVVKEIVKRFAHKIIEMDKAYAPFSIEALEQGGMIYNVPIDFPPYKAIVSGKIDRIDRKGNILRIIDYKTGKDTLNFDSVASLFTREGKRNKAAFQTLLYALLYDKTIQSTAANRELKIIPGLINRLNLFDDEFSFGLKHGREIVNDVHRLLPEFETEVQKVFNELFNPEQPFDQTTDSENCKLCSYSQLCYR